MSDEAAKAYGLLWQAHTDDARVHEARRLLLSTLTKVEQRTAIEWAKRTNEMETVLDDLLSWFPDKASEPKWELKGGKYGADDAIAAARALKNGAEQD